MRKAVPIILIIFSTAILSYIVCYTLMLMRQHSISCNIIILTSKPGIEKYFNRSIANKDICIYMLNTHNIASTYYVADTIIIITHSAKLPDGVLLISLNEEPDLLTRYIIKVGDKMYKAITIRDLAVHLKSNTIVLAGCNITFNDVYHIFRGRTLKVYYYRCESYLEDIVEDIKRIISGREPHDPCFMKIDYITRSSNIK